MSSARKLLTVLLFMGFSASAVPVVATSPGRLDLLSGSISVGQVSNDDSATRRQVEDWLGKAKKAMQAGRFKEADFWISRAEQQKLNYDPVAARYAYTPAKARAELASMQGRPAQASGQIERLPHLPENTRRPPATLSPGQASRFDNNRLPLGGNAPGPSVRDSSFQRNTVSNPNQIRPQNDPLRRSPQVTNDRRALPTSRPPQNPGWPNRQAGYQGDSQRFPVSQGAYNRENDRTRNTPASASGRQTNFSGLPPVVNTDTIGKRLYQQGLTALQQQNRDAALDHFRQAWKYKDQLDPQTRQDLQDKLNFLPRAAAENRPRGPRAPAFEEVSGEQQVKRQKIQQEVFRERAAAEDMRKKDPKGALLRLRKLHDRVADSSVDTPFKTQLLSVVGRSVSEMERYIDQNRAQIESDEVNRGRLEDVNNRRVRRLEIQNELALMVEQFNKLIDENRFAEADVLARQAYELAPDEPVVQNLVQMSRMASRVRRNLDIADEKERGFYDALRSVDESGIPFDDSQPINFGNATEWRMLSATRSQQLREMNNRLSPEELRLQQVLRTEKVDVRFNNQPLRQVLDLLADQAGVNIHLDQRGLHAEAVTSDTPVTINLTQPISLRSALNLILNDLNLDYVIQDEVVRVTSEELRDEQVYQQTYYVADLVIPIPDFVPSYNMGLPGAIAAAHNALGYGRQVPASGTMPFTVANNPAAGGMNPLNSDPRALANVGSGSMSSTRSPQPIGFHPGGGGGGPIADFDSLIELITTTIAPTTWDEVGGPGSVSGFETNLSLVVSQTQEVHEQISDLLQQLRRLQDLQVTIEVRFITVADSFFEQIGIDFDFDVDDNVGIPTQFVQQTDRGVIDDTGPSVMFGLDAQGMPTADFDLQFTQDIAAGAPTFPGGIVPGMGANFGFAILSDIEVFFLLNAAQGDDRSNVMTAPKVTLFNGQQAFVSDTSQTPFVTSIIPVVGDFAAAHQPVIVVLSEGTSLSVQAVVSADRRFVRLTLVPFFSRIGDVQEFTFNGKTITRTSSGNTDDGNGGTSDAGSTETSVEGTTVQLPTFNFQTVTTTVSVPDGGTVLLGGIKRLSEGRNERGIPLLSKLPYVNRLFRNVGIARTTRSLMMMVTPRIIIQEEEEARAVGRVLNP